MSYATAEYIRPLTDVVGPEVEEWDGWAQINEAVQANGMFEGARYGIPQGTDGRVIYFNKEIFAAAGLPEDWQPTTIEEVLEAARTIKEAQPGRHPDPAQRRCGDGRGDPRSAGSPTTARRRRIGGVRRGERPVDRWHRGPDRDAHHLRHESMATRELGDTDLQLLQDGRDRSFEAFANGEVSACSIEGDYFWRSVIHPDPEQALFPMENHDEVVGWATIPAYEPGGTLGGLNGTSMSGGAGAVEPEHRASR